MSITNVPGPPGPPAGDLPKLTRARIGLGRTGASLPTKALLAFTLDHGRARDAVHATFEAAALVSDLETLGLATLRVSSEARGREEYLRRPDLGRKLDARSCDLLTGRTIAACDVAVVIGDGLSPPAVNAHAIEVVRILVPRLAAAGIQIGAAVVATQARVALGDEIGLVIGARMLLMLIGERPGLSAPDSLGVYLTFGPKPGLSDAQRNCVSNIHLGGLRYDEAASKIAWLVREGLSRQITGVALKDESGIEAPARLGGGHGPP